VPSQLQLVPAPLGCCVLPKQAPHSPVRRLQSQGASQSLQIHVFGNVSYIPDKSQSLPPEMTEVQFFGTVPGLNKDEL